MESIYENALRVALRKRGLPFEHQAEVRVLYEGCEVGSHRLDLIVQGEIVVELKAIKALEDVHYAQVRSYLRATGLHVGLLLNFNTPTLIIKPCYDGGVRSGGKIAKIEDREAEESQSRRDHEST